MTSVSKKATVSTRACIHSLEFFCELTKKAYAPCIVDTDHVLRGRNGWTRLADLWEELIGSTGKDIFVDILYLIKWGQLYRQSPNAAYTLLVETACAELLSDTPAFYAWTKHYFFKCCIQGIDDEFYRRTTPHPYCHSRPHRWYTDSEMTIKLWRYQHGHKKDCKIAACYIEHYKETIIKLIPSACSWAPDYWLDENHIHDEILRVHNVDYRDNPTEYEHLLTLLGKSNSESVMATLETCKILVRLKIFSLSIAQIIWPEYTQDTLLHFLFFAERRARNHFESPSGGYDIDFFAPPDINYTLLNESWLFSFVSQQLYAGNLPLSCATEVKKTLLTITMRT